MESVRREVDGASPLSWLDSAMSPRSRPLLQLTRIGVIPKIARGDHEELCRPDARKRKALRGRRPFPLLDLDPAWSLRPDQLRAAWERKRAIVKLYRAGRESARYPKRLRRPDQRAYD